MEYWKILLWEITMTIYVCLMRYNQGKIGNWTSKEKGFLFFITYRFPFNYRSGSLNSNKDEGAKRNVQRIYRRICLSVEQITQLIYFSPVLLQQKKQAFYRLRDLAEKNQDEILKKECHRYISNMEEALSYLRVNGIISV